jgi:hypothetical protein
MAKYKLLLFTHITTLVTGIYIGKKINEGELTAYRSLALSSSDDSTFVSYVKKVILLIGATTIVLVSGKVLFFGIGGSSNSISSGDKKLN